MRKMNFISLLIILAMYEIPPLFAKGQEPDEVVFSLLTDGQGYHGNVLENNSTAVIQIKPVFRTQGSLLCGFSLLPPTMDEAGQDLLDHLPFKVTDVDQQNGTGTLVLTKELDCEEKSNYEFEILAYSCSGDYSESVRVSVYVDDENEFGPTWVNHPTGQDAIIDVSVTETTEVIDKILDLEAKDDDCSQELGTVCSYAIQKPTEPFVISSKGRLATTGPLLYSSSNHYVLTVVASDCGGLQSAPLKINIQVQKPCVIGWTGIDNKSTMTYMPSTGPMQLFPNAEFTTCSKKIRKPVCSNPISATTVVQLMAKNQKCDNFYSVSSQKRMCDLHSKTIDLINVDNDEKNLSKKDIIEFHGNNSGFLVPSNILDEGTLGSQFTISAWMKHTAVPKKFAVKNRIHEKEHIFCISDDHAKNRHHLALFLRNCKLILLIRQTNNDDADLFASETKRTNNIFRPAEWRWSIPQVCDGFWHHYSISVNFPRVELVIDGNLFKSTPENPEIIDDWPMHKVPGLVHTKTAVGACWQGSTGSFLFGFYGLLAGVSVLKGANENIEVLKCINECTESLQLSSAASICSTNTDQDHKDSSSSCFVNVSEHRIMIKIDEIHRHNQLLRGLAYINIQEFPEVGPRHLELKTWLDCSSLQGQVKNIQLETYLIDIHVAKSIPQTKVLVEPTIIIDGSVRNNVGYESLKNGVRIMKDVHISVVDILNANQKFLKEDITESEKNFKSQTANFRSSSCHLVVEPPLNNDHEKISISDKVPNEKLGVKAKVSLDGLTLTGLKDVTSYQNILAQIVYTNKMPAYYITREFRLVCSSQINGDEEASSSSIITSNALIITFIIRHPPIVTSDSENFDSLSSELVLPPHNSHLLADSIEGYSIEQKTSTNEIPDQIWSLKHSHLVITMVVLVATTFMFILLIIGIIKLKSIHIVNEEDTEDFSEMDWDDTAHNITVNPMEEEIRLSPFLRRVSPSDDWDPFLSHDTAVNVATSSDESNNGSSSEEEDDNDDETEPTYTSFFDGRIVHTYRNRHHIQWDNIV